MKGIKFIIGFLVAVVAVGLGLTVGENSLRVFEKPEPEVVAIEAPPMESVVVGVLGDFENSRWKSLKNGVDLAYSKFELHDVSVFYEDTACDAETAEAKFIKLQTMEVDVLVGGICSEVSQKLAELSQEAGVVYVNSSDQYSSLIGLGDFVFRTVAPFSMEPRFISRYLRDEKGFSQMGIYHDGNANNKSYAEKIEKEYSKYLSGTVEFVNQIPKGNKLDSESVADLRFDTPGAVVVIADDPGKAGVFINNLHDSGIKPLFFGPKSLKTDRFAAAAGLASEGFVTLNYPEGTPEFKDNYENKFGSIPDIKSVQGYDAALPVFQAIYLKARNPESIKKKLHGLAFQAASGQLSFGDDGERGVRYDIYEVKGGRFVKTDSK